MAKSLPIPILESAGYIVATHTKKDWLVFSLQDNNIVLKENTVVCKGMTYMNRHKNKVGMAMTRTVHKNFESFVKNKLEK